MKIIEHDGVVDQISGSHVKVKIVSESACASCHAKGACTAADIQDKEVDIITSETFKPGDHVVLIGQSSQGLKAAWWAYILPVVLMLLTLSVVFSSTGNESLAGFLALLILVPYYLIIRLANKAMKQTFSFTIKSKSE